MKIHGEIVELLLNKGINSVNPQYYDRIDLWRDWYSGCVEDFHYYNVKLADCTTVQKEKLTMNCAKKVSEDMQKLLWSNKVQINLDSEEKTKALWEILEYNNFSVMMPRQLELCSALGTVAFSEFISNNKVIIEFIGDSNKIIPYNYSNNKISSMVAINQFTRVERGKMAYYTHLAYHEFKENVYTKYNELYKSKTFDDLGKQVLFSSLFPNVQEIVVYENVEYPHFQVLKFPIVNNYDLENPMGISIYGNSIDRFKALDTKYDSFNNEFISGKKRILVDASALKGVPQVDGSGNISTALYFDKNDTTYVALRGMDQQPIKEIDFNIRYQEHIDSIQSELNWLSSNIGFGENFYNFSGTQPMTATEVMSRDSDAYRTKDGYDSVLIECIETLVKAVCYLAGIQTSTVEVVTDYSRFKNDSAEQSRLMQEVNNGITSKIEYRVKIYNEDEILARKKIEEIQSNEPTVDQLVGA
jgi:A118 family predicted phage portal protein